MKSYRHRLLRNLSDDRGYATVVSAGIIVAVASVALVLISAGGLVVSSHRARNAADLAAVAGAHAWLRGEDGCAVADKIVRENDARLVSCRTHAADVWVTAGVSGHTATARAGPL